MKRNKLLAIVILFAVVVCCTSLFFACNTGTQDSEESLRIFYDWSDGSEPIEKVIKAKDVASVTSALTPPTRDGYVFIGWSLTKDGDRIVFSEGTVITDGATLYALWQYTKITLYYDLQDGSDTVEKLIEKADIKSTSQSMVATKEGYDFAGWSLAKSGDILDLDNLPIIEDGATLYAQWKVKEYTVIFSIDDFNIVEKQSVEHGKTATLPSKETMAEYVEDGKLFVGWVYQDGSAFDENTPITQRTVVYAVFDDVSYTVKFQDGDDVIKQSTGNVGLQIVAPLATEQPSKTGYTFSHWATKDGKKFEEGAVYQQDETYYATYTLNAPSKPSLSGNNSITYGESQIINAQINDSVNDVTYSYVWFMGDDELGKESSVTLNKLTTGEYTVRCEAIASDGTLTSTKSTQTFTFIVEKATLIATIEDVNLVYGDELPDFTPTYTGFKYDDDANVIFGDLEPNTNYNTGATVGTYYAQIEGLTADNYIIVGTVGTDKAIQATITVAKKVVTLKDGIKLEASKTYDGNSYSYNFLDEDYGECFVDGLLDGHHIRVSVNTKGQSNAKEYTGSDLAVAYSIFDDDNDFTQNYDVQISENDVSVTIEKADIDYTASDINDLVYTGKAQQPKNFLNVNLSIGYDLYYSTTLDDIETTQNKTVPSYTNVEPEAKLCFRIDAGTNYNIVTDFVWVQIERAQITFKARPQTAIYGEAFALNQTAYDVVKNDSLFIDDNEFTVTLSTEYKIGYIANTYSITIDVVPKHDNFSISVEEAELTVDKATLRVVMNGTTISYGESINNVAYDIESGLYEGDKDRLDTIIDAYVYGYKPGNPAGTYAGALTCDIFDDTNYTLVLTEGTLTVEKKAVSVTFIEDENGKPIFRGYVYGDNNQPSFDYINGTQDLFYANDYFEHFYADVQYSYNYVAYDEATQTYGNAGTYSVTVSIKEDSYTYQNYDITFTNKDGLAFVVDKRYVCLVLNSANVTYGETLSNNALTYTLSEGSNDFRDEDKNNLNITYTYGYKAGEWGTFRWSMSVGNSNYEVEYNDVNARITVTARPVKITYTKTNIAQNSGEFSFDIIDKYADDLYDGDTITSGTFTLKSTEEIGEYKFNYVLDEVALEEVALVITCDGNDVTGCYNITFDITLKVIEIQIDHEFTPYENCVYNGLGQYPALLEYDGDVSVLYTYKDAQSGETITSSDMPTFKDAGTYEITYTLTQEGKSPYSHTFTFTIKPYAFEIVIYDPHSPDDSMPPFRVQFGDDFSVDEGQRYYNFKSSTESDVWADLNTTYDALINELNIQVNPNYEVGVTGAGLHDVIVTWKENPNYIITCDAKNKLKVTPQPVVVYGGNYTTVYGEEAVAYTQGFSTHLYVYGETYDPSSPMFNNTANDIAKLAAQYITITPINYTAGDCGTFTTTATCTNNNYEVKVCEVEMTVVARSITIKANNVEMTYGDNMPTLSYSIVSGSLYGDDTLDVTFATSNVTGIGTYDIVPVVATSDKYAVTVQNGTLTVTKATLTATLVGLSTITYGDDMPTYSASYTGFKYNDNASVVNGTIAISCDYITQKGAGTFAVTASGLDADNYDIKFEDFNLSVNKATLTATLVGTQSITYGDDMPTYSASYTGFKYNDNASVVNGTIAISCDYITQKGAGTFAVTASGLDADNYDIKFEDFNLSVNKATLHICANSHNAITYGDDLPTDFTYTATGFVNGDTTTSVLAGKISFSCSYTKGNNAGSYQFNVVCGELDNYTAVIGEAQSLVVNKKQAVITGSKVYSTDYNEGNDINLEAVITDVSSNNTQTDLIRTIKIYNTDTIVDKITDGGVYTITYSQPETTNFLAPQDLVVTLKVVFVEYNGTLYTLEGALNATTSGTLTVKGNGFVSSNVTVPSGITLELPGDSSDTGNAKTPTYGSGVSSYVDNNATYISHKLTINTGATVTVNGTIIIRGLLGVQDTGLSGHTSGLHSQIINNGEITLNSGSTLAARGYIKGTGHATYNSGATIYAPFVIVDFRGGTSTVGAYSSGKISPFNEFEMPNIQCAQRIYSGSNVIGYCDLYISTDNEHKTTTAKIFGSSSALINLTSGYVDKTYYSSGTSYKNDRKTTLNIYGDIKTGSLNMKIDVSVISADVDTSAVFFPISYRYAINMLSGSATVKSSFKFLPGSSLYVASGASVYLDTSDKYNAQLSFYEESDWSDTGSGAPTRTYPDGKGDATFTLGGTITMSGKKTYTGRDGIIIKTFTVYSGIGGKIYALNGASISTNSESIVSITTSEGYGYTEGTSVLDKLNAKYKETASITKTSTLVNADGSTVAVSKGTTYTYNGSSWS